MSLATSRSGQPSLVVIEQSHAQRFRTAVENAAGGGDIFKRPVAAIVKEPAGGAAIGFGRAIGFVLAVEAAENVVLRRPLHVIADEQVEQAIAIVVEPQRGGAEALALAESAGIGHVHECSLAGVMEQAVLTDAGDEDVREAIVVVIADRDAHAIQFDIEAGAGGHVRESAVVVVAIKARVVRRFLVAGPVGCR